jgi:WD40 repeat protein
MTKSRIAFVATIMLATVATPSLGNYLSLNVPNRRDYAFDQAGILYITSGPDIVRFNTQSATFLTPFNVGGSLVGLDISPDGGNLAVADASTQGANNRIELVNTSSGQSTAVSFTRQSSEAGTFMTAWGSDNRILITSNFGGSGWVPLRRYDPQSGVTTTIASVTKNTMLTPSADRRTIGLAESDISSGPVRAFDVTAGSIVASRNTNWFLYEVAVDRDGDRFAVPTYGGALIYDRAGSSFTQIATLGQYATHVPIGAVFSPINDVLFTSEYDDFGTLSGVKVYNALTWSLIATLDTYNFPLDAGLIPDGRMEISPDGHWLVTSVQDGARLYDVSSFTPEPSMIAALAFAFVLMRSPRGRLKKSI